MVVEVNIHFSLSGHPPADWSIGYSIIRSSTLSRGESCLPILISKPIADPFLTHHSMRLSTLFISRLIG